MSIHRKPGVLIAARFPPDELKSLAATAERSGIGQIWLGDERFYREIYSCLAWLSAHTSTVKLATCVTDPYSRHPAMTAAAIATLDELSNQRAILGFGVGISGFEEMGIDRKKPLVAIRESLEVIKALLCGDEVEYKGEVVSFNRGELHFRPVRSDIPVYIASNGPLVQKLAGRIADGVIMEACGSVSEAKAFVDRVHQSAEAAGRRKTDVECIARLNYCVADNGTVARDALRPRVARNLIGGYMSFSSNDPKLSLPDDVVSRFSTTPYRAGVAPYAAISDLISDYMVDAIALGGTKSEIIQHVVELRNAGIDNIIISPNPAPGDTVENNIEIFAQDIWPEVERRSHK